ncbi:peptidase E [Paenibacillus sp. V4I3]|nr:peptidase E [Paenibacillus sp. V4I3]MDQ0889745.1 peptidase E [Paenibacillus sp. V4I9]
MSKTINRVLLKAKPLRIGSGFYLIVGVSAGAILIGPNIKIIFSLITIEKTCSKMIQRK